MIENKRPKVFVFIATSLDGFISRKDGSIDWLTKFNEAAPPGEDCGYKEFISSIDLIVMGRNTFEQVLTFGEWPYNKIKLVVLSSKLKHVPEHLKKMVTLDSDTPKNLLLKLSSKGYKNIYLDGGITIQKFLNEGMIDEITITTIPILIGEGKPLFGHLNGDVRLELVQSKSYHFGVVQSKYNVFNLNRSY